MRDISFENALKRVREINSEMEEIVRNPEQAVEKSKSLLSKEILIGDEHFYKTYGVSFKEAKQEQRDEYLGLMKYLTNITDEISKAVRD